MSRPMVSQVIAYTSIFHRSFGSDVVGGAMIESVGNELIRFSYEHQSIDELRSALQTDVG